MYGLSGSTRHCLRYCRIGTNMCEGGGEESCFLGGCCCSQPSALRRLCWLRREEGAAQTPAPGWGHGGYQCLPQLVKAKAPPLFDGFMSASAASWPGRGWQLLTGSSVGVPGQGDMTMLTAILDTFNLSAFTAILDMFNHCSLM